MELRKGDYVSTKGMTEEQYHAVAKAFMDAGANSLEYPSIVQKGAFSKLGITESNNIMHWDMAHSFGKDNRELTIAQVLGADSAKEWDGTGLPSVGCVVDVCLVGTEGNKRTIRVTYSCAEVVCGEVIYCEHGARPGTVAATETCIYKYKPHKTEQQRYIDEFKSATGSGNKVARKAYEAGYRK